MTEHHFARQIGRLEQQFVIFGTERGKFGTERAAMLWNEVKDLSDFWFTKTIDKFIADSRQTPLIADFRDDISKERERLWKIEKERHAKEAKEFYSGTFQAEDIRLICRFTIKIMLGEATEDEKKSFYKMLKHVPKSLADQKQFHCLDCGNSGLVFQKVDQYEYVYRCHCSAGQSKPKNYPVWKP